LRPDHPPPTWFSSTGPREGGHTESGYVIREEEDKESLQMPRCLGHTAESLWLTMAVLWKKLLLGVPGAVHPYYHSQDSPNPTPNQATLRSGTPDSIRKPIH
jgi:hypothetical protein